MKLYHRIISICMSLLLLLGALPMQVMAADLKEASQHTVSMSNKYIKVIVNKDNGRFAIRTADGQPLRKNDQDTTLTFDEDDTSFTTFRITDGTYKGEYIFGNGYELNGGNNLKSSLSAPAVTTAADGTQTMVTTWTLTLNNADDQTIVIDQKIRLNASDDTDTSGMVFVDYDVKNNTSASISVGTRVLLDTKVGANDGPTYQNGTEQEQPINVETELTGTDIKNYFMMRDNGSYTNPLTTSVYAYGFNNVGNDDATVENARTGSGDLGNLVDKIVVGHWAHLANSKYEVTIDPNLNFANNTNDYGTADSAIAYFWNDDSIASGAKQSYRVVYGLGEILLDDSEFLISFIDQKSQLETNDAKTAYLSDGVFDVTVQVQCSEQSKLSHDSITATLTLENGLSFVETRNGQVVYENGKPKKCTGVWAYTQTSTYTKSKTSVDQESNPFTAGDMTVFRYKVMAEGKSWPTTKEFMFSVTSDALKNAAASKRKNESYAVNESTCTRSDFILLPAIGETQQSRAYSLAPEQAYFEDEKIISVGLTNFGGYTQGTKDKSTDGYWYPDRNFDVYLYNVLTGERYLVDPGDITLVDKDGANGVMNIDYHRGTKIEADNANPYLVNPDLTADDPTIPVGKYAVEVKFKSNDAELNERMSFVSSQQIDVNMNKEARLRTGAYLTVARRYMTVSPSEFNKYTDIVKTLNAAGQRVNKESVQYKWQSGNRIPYYEVKVLRDESELNAYKETINSLTSFNDNLGWTTETNWSNGEILLEIKGKVKEQDGGYLVDTSVEPAVINRTVTYTGTALTLNKEGFIDSFAKNTKFANDYASIISGPANTAFANLSDAQKGKINDEFTLGHWVLAGNGNTSISGSKYTFYKEKWNIDFFDGFAKSLFLQDRFSDYADRFDDSNVYNVSNLTASQAGFKQHNNGLTSEQSNPLEIIAETDVYFNQLGLVEKYDYNPGSIQLLLEDYRLSSYHDSYRVKMGGHVNFTIFDGTVDDVSFDTQGFYGVDANCGFDIWKNIGILKKVGDEYYSEGYDQKQAETTNQIASSGRAVEAGAALLIRAYRPFASPEKDNIFAVSAKFKLPILGGFYVGFTFKEVADGMILPDCYAFQYFAKSSSKDVATGAAGAAGEAAAEAAKEGTKEAAKQAAKQRQAIPGIQIGPNLYMTRVRVAVRNLADTVYGLMTGENVGSLPLQLAGGITVSMPMGLGTFASRVAIIGNIDMLLKMTGLKITGSMELELWVVSLPLINLAEFQVQWSDPSFVSAKILVDIFNAHILVGKGSIFIGEREDGDFDFDAYISAAIAIPEKVPVVGGLSLAKAYFGVSLESITGGFTILPFVLVNLEYFWGGGVDDINFWVSTDGTPKEEALAYLVHTDEESGQQSVLSIGKNISYVATSDYDPENAGQKLVYRSTEGADELLVYRSAGLGGITVDGTKYTVPLSEVYDSTNPANALIEMEYFDEVPDATSVTIGGDNYTLVEYLPGSEMDEDAAKTGNKLYYYTQERDMDGTTQKMMYVIVPYEQLHNGADLVMELDQNVDMALLRVGKGATLDSVTLTQEQANPKQITMSANVTNAKDGDVVKFFLTQNQISEPTKTETIGVTEVAVDDLGSMGMLVGSKTLSQNTGTQTASVTIDDMTECPILDKEGVNLHELLESGNYYLRAVLDAGDVQDVKQTENFVKLEDPEAPKEVTGAQVELGGNGQLTVSFKPDDTGNVPDAFVLNFYVPDEGTDTVSDYAYYTDLMIERDEFEQAEDGTLSYTLGTWTEMQIETEAENSESTETAVKYAGFKTGADTAYKAKVKAVRSVEIDNGTKYHYSKLSDFATVPASAGDYRIDATTINLPTPQAPKISVTNSGVESYYKQAGEGAHGEGVYDTTKTNEFAYYSLATNEKEPQLTIKNDDATAVTLKLFNGSEPVWFRVGDEEAVKETTIAANSETTIKLQGFGDADTTANLTIFARNKVTKDAGRTSLRLVTDYTAPTLYIDSPVNGTASVNGSVSFSGMTNASDSVVTVYVDGSAAGTPLTVDADGKISGMVALNTTKPTAQLRVEAKDAAGNTNAAQVTVQNGSYEVAQNIVLRTYKSGNTVKVETVGRFANGRNADGSVAYAEKPVSGVTYSTYRGDAKASANGTVTFGSSDASIIEGTYNTPDGATLTAMTVVRKDSVSTDPTPGTNTGSDTGTGSATGTGTGTGTGAATGDASAETETLKADESKTTVNNKSVEVAVAADTNIVTIDATGTGEKDVKTTLEANGYAIEYTTGSTLNVDTPIFKAELDSDMLGTSGTVTVVEVTDASATSAGSSVVSATSVDLGGSGDLNAPVKVSVAIPDDVSVSDVTAVMLRDKTGKVTPLPYTLNMIGDEAFVDVLLPDEGEIVLEKCQTGFTDVTRDNWAYDEIMAAAAREIINGVSNGVFDRTSSCTRSSFATILMRTGGMMTQETTTTLPDVAKGAWDYQALAIAKDLGVISGFEDGTIRGGSPVSRTEAMVMVGRFLNVMGVAQQLSDAEVEELLKAFSDGASIPAWARSSVALCVKAGIINGMNGAINGSGSLTREQCAAIANRIDGVIVENLLTK